jgi:presenilin-like A22 family membrane protease
MIPKDKQYHFFAGFIIYLFSQFIFTIWFALIPVIAIATAKEVYDYISKKGTPEINDLLYTIYGAIPTIIFKLLLP